MMIGYSQERNVQNSLWSLNKAIGEHSLLIIMRLVVIIIVVTVICGVNSRVNHKPPQKFYSDTYAKTICENETIKLTCPTGMVEVIDAFFGRNTVKKCYDGPSADDINCQSPDGSTQKVQQECNYKKFCNIPANVYFFTSGCGMNVSKYLDIFWTCVKGPPYLNQYACEHDELHIDCKHKFIKIYEAFYGRNDVYKCNEVENVTISTNTCLSKIDKTTYEVYKRCEDLHRCTIKVENDVINECCDDPCPGTPKFLDVNYFCVDP